MAEYRGSALLVEWIGTWGTVDCSAQYKKISFTHEADMLDSSAGTVQYREFIPGLLQWSISGDFLQNGTSTPIGGTQFVSLFLPGQSGTVRVSPGGTATGNQKYTGAALLKTASQEFPFDDVVTTTIEWQGNGYLTIANY
jgi:hypothetical protein